jgi:predicted aspartyl protease
VKSGGLALLLSLLLPGPVWAQAAPPVDTPPPPEQVFIKPATIDNNLEVTGDPVAAKEVNFRMQVGVLVNDKGPYRFFVDSGADRSVIGFNLAQRLGLPAGPDVILHSTGSAQQTHTVHINSLRVGTSTIRDISAPALPERFLGGDGMLGIDALIDQRLTIDFDKKTVVVQDAQQREAPGGPDEVVITARRRKGQLILTQARTGNTQIAAVIDTGTEVTVGNSALRAKLLRRNRTPVMTTTLISVTGDEIPADLLPVPEIRIGDLVMHNVLIAFSDVPPFKLFGLADEPAILLGSDLLSSFRKVSLDFRRRKVRFTLRPDGSSPGSGQDVMRIRFR